MVPFKFADKTDLEKKSDLTLAGNMMDCGECHVGGGAMEYVPNKSLDARVSLRDIATADVNGGGPLTETDYTAFNYFIDTYDVDGDGDKNEAQYIDYAKTGVMEMDCFVCHLPGYKYEERTAALRKGKIDATRAIGAGIATENDLVWDSATGAPEGYGTTVNYDASIVTIDGTTGAVTIPSTWMGDNVAGKPDSVSCANCHMNEFSVDWKKRGDHWAPEGQYDFQYEVHYSLGCMGCHERTDGALTADGVSPYRRDPATYPQNYTLQGAGMLGHDPAKGNAPYSSLYNVNDKAAFKSCEDCHITGVADGRSYGAPNPTAAHEAAGLTAKIVQATSSTAGVPSISHIDLMDCSACHSRKAESYDWGNTGAPLIDATGTDAAGRLTDHENHYVIREDMTDQTSLAWYAGKLLRVNPSATMFWRDKNDFPYTGAAVVGIDANMDGTPGGVDALLQTQVLKTNLTNGWGSITEDHEGNVTPADFAERISALTTDIQAWTGQGTPAIRFSIFHVNFKDQHSVSPAAMAFGANGCTDCHDANAEFYNGGIDTTGTNNTMVYASGTAQRTPFTKVNGFSQPTDWHPGQMDKLGKRSIAIQVSTAATTWLNPATGLEEAAMTTRPVQRSENMYEATFMGAADYISGTYEGSAITFSGFEKGWLLMVEVKETATGTVKSYTKSIGADVTDLTGLMGQISTQFKDGSFGFVVAENTAGTGIKITAEPGYEFRLKGGVSNAQDFGLIGATYKATPWTGVDGNSYNGRADWVAYLNSITPEAAGIGIDPVAVIADSVPAEVEVGATVTLAADASVNTQGSFTYNWICNDTAEETLVGESVSKTFSKVGTWTVTLKVIDEEGKVAQVAKQVNVVVPAPAADIEISSPLPAGSVQSVSFNNLPAEYTKLYIIWGDGTKQYEYPVGSPASVNVDHKYLMYSKYFDGTNYNYKTLVYVYNGAVRVGIMQATLSIAP